MGYATAPGWSHPRVATAGRPAQAGQGAQQPQTAASSSAVLSFAYGANTAELSPAASMEQQARGARGGRFPHIGGETPPT